MAVVSSILAAPVILLLLWLALIALTGLLWVVLIARRASYLFAIGTIVLLGLFAVLLTMMATAVLDIPILFGLGAVVMATAVVGIALCVFDRSRLRRPTSTLPWLVAGIGPALWLGMILLAQVVPGAARVAWAMQGDAANNVLFAREIIAQNGIATGAGSNPVPLPAALLAASSEIGRASATSEGLLGHDVAALAAIWTALVAVSALLAALAAAAIARASGGRQPVVILSAGIGTVLPLSWFVTGYPLEYGFFNTHLALIVLFAVILVFLESSRPAVTLALIAVSGTVLCAVWSPLVVVPAALGVLLVATRRRELIATRGIALLVVVAGIVQLAVYGLAVVLPGLVANAEALGAPGGAYRFPGVLLPLAAVSALVLAWTAVRRVRSGVVAAVFTVAAALGGGLGVLLVASHGQWTYYPLKFAWLATVTLVVMMAGLVLPSLTRLTSRPVLLAPAAALVVVGLAGFAIASPTVASGERREHPFSWILTGNVMGEANEVSDQILTLVDDDQARILWKTRMPFEATINFWLIQMQVDSISDQFDLRTAAYAIGGHSTVRELCANLGLLGDGVAVLTRDSDLAVELEQSCPQVDAHVSVLEER